MKRPGGAGPASGAGHVPGARPSRLRRTEAVLGALFSVLYLTNLTWGMVEFLPDALPIVGNLDEAGMTAFLLYCLRVLGVEVLPGARREG